MEASTQPGGVNAHLGATRILAARIVTNRGEKHLVAGYLKDPNQHLGWALRGVHFDDPVGVEFAYGS